MKKKGIENPFVHKSYISLLEKVEIIELLQSRSESTFNELSNLINNLFSDDFNKENSVMLSTIHRSKGLENERVFIIGYDSLMPSPYAKTPLEKYQEKCTMFVAVTRAIKELIFINY